MKSRHRTAARAWTLLARTALVLAGAAMALSGCACEGPGRGLRAGPEVPLIRVKLGDDAPSVSVAVTGPWAMTGGGGEVAAGEKLDWTDVTARGGQVIVGSVATVPGAVDVRGRKEASVWVAQTVGGKRRERCYRGAVRIAPTAEGTLRIINTLPMEPYVAGVVANELLKSWHVEAYKAQAIAARTYALMSRNARLHRDFDVYDSTSSQVYGGAGTETATGWRAVEATWGIVAATSDASGKPVLLRTYYHSTCGGDTVPAGDVLGGQTPPPLAGGTKCTYCRNSPKYHWPEVVLTKQDVADVLRRSGLKEFAALPGVARVEVAERFGEGGRARKIRIVDTAGAAFLVHANRWRILVGAGKVPSTWFDIEDRSDRIALTNGRGYGHGVGLCQWGAEYLARNGKTGEEILRYYYPKVELIRAY